MSIEVPVNRVRLMAQTAANHLQWIAATVVLPAEAALAGVIADAVR